MLLTRLPQERHPPHLRHPRRRCHPRHHRRHPSRLRPEPCAPPRFLNIRPGSCVTIRTRTDALGALMKLVGKTLELDGHTIKLQPPRVYPLVPAVALKAHVHCSPQLTHAPAAGVTREPQV
ncbi:MAG: type I-MYXAN CRISPR-associated protein Cas6/Cmx6 [Myxococcota bacterium]